jgi:hypothetical protein
MAKELNLLEMVANEQPLPNHDRCHTNRGSRETAIPSKRKEKKKM